jgi:MFS family permease
LFVAARALQGVANAFVTPMLLAGLTEVIAPGRLGRAIGVFSSFQAAGTALAPFVAGLLARANWRLVFVVVAVVALLLATRPPNGDPRPAAAAPPIRPLLTVQMVLLWIAAFAAAAGPLGAAVIVGLFLRDELDVGSAAGGAVLFLGGFASMLLGPTWGRLLDQWGAVKASAVSCLALSALVAPLGYFASAGWFAAMWMIAGGFTGFLVINLQNLSAVAVPDNRGGALSSVMSFRFFGHALGPLMWVPVFDRSPEAAFVGVGALGLLALVALVGAAVRITAAGAPDAPTNVN